MASRHLDWPTLAVLFGMYAVLLGNFALYWTAPLPLALHVLVSAAAIHLAFTVWHEAVHRNVSRRPEVNQWVGVAGIFPYMAPYFMSKWVHLRHHARLNERDDPNLVYTDGPLWALPLRYPRALRYAREVMKQDPRSRRERRLDAAALAGVAGIYAVAWWFGVFWDVVLLWFVPVLLAKFVMDWYINYLPHVGLPAHRFRGTRILDIGWLTPLVLAHNYHAIHHLWPSIPWHRYRSVFRQRLDYLKEHGVPIERRLLGGRLRPDVVHADPPLAG